MKLNIQCFPSLVITGIPVVSMSWDDGRNGYVENNCPCFAILYQTGQLQIMKNQNDEGDYLYIFSVIYMYKHIHTNKHEPKNSCHKSSYHNKNG